MCEKSVNHYDKIVMYRFEVSGILMDILGYTDDYVYMEEVRKNGQEDCHVQAEFSKENGKWVLMDDELDWDELDWDPNIILMFGRSFVNDIIDYLTVNGLPKDE